jgi:ADP-heptose:LPS heptosyltransferase
MLDTGLATDEHEDFLFRDVPNVISLRDRLEPRTNLGVQTAVTATAQGFIGTCGSLAWLAPMLGVKTVAVYADERLLTTHLYVARQVYRRMGAAPFETLDLRAALELDLLAAAAQEVGR